MEAALETILTTARRQGGNILVLTGAGISAESGIPTFRGDEGFWIVGSRNYMPQEMATVAMFRQSPEEVWRWYLDRFGAVLRAEPNAGHRAIVDLEAAVGDRFTLVTQNIDGLHRRAGSSDARMYCIHGDAAWVRCADGCDPARIPVPAFEPGRDRERPLSLRERELLTCPRCGGWLRPHVLWFDEAYDEANYRFDSTLQAAERADLLLVVGTSGATNLPLQVGVRAWQRGIPIVDVNPHENLFAEMAVRSRKGFFARGKACERLPEIVRLLT